MIRAPHKKALVAAGQFNYSAKNVDNVYIPANVNLAFRYSSLKQKTDDLLMTFSFMRNYH